MYQIVHNYVYEIFIIHDIFQINIIKFYILRFFFFWVLDVSVTLWPLSVLRPVVKNITLDMRMIRVFRHVLLQFSIVPRKTNFSTALKILYFNLKLFFKHIIFNLNYICLIHRFFFFFRVLIYVEFHNIYYINWF